MDHIPHITSSEHRIRWEEDDYTHIAATIFVVWAFAVAYVANWLAGG